MTDYSALTDEDFDEILSEITIENAASLLLVPGAYEVFSEHYNNEVLARWESRKNDQAD